MLKLGNTMKCSVASVFVLFLTMQLSFALVSSKALSRHKRQNDYNNQAREQEEQQQKEQEEEEKKYQEEMQKEKENEEKQQQEQQKQQEEQQKNYRYKRSMVHNKTPIPMPNVGTMTNIRSNQQYKLTCLEYLEMIFNLLLQDRMDRLMGRILMKADSKENPVSTTPITFGYPLPIDSQPPSNPVSPSPAEETETENPK